VSPGLLLGADGGNTKTIALVAGRDGTILGAGRSGNSDLYNAPSVDAALASIAAAAAQALSAGGASAADVDAACFSLAGADWSEDFELLRRELPARIGLSSEPLIVNDAVGAIRAGTSDGVGTAVVCGTYGVSSGRNAAGEVFHLGFWPDSCGARPLAREALAAVWRADLGYGPATSLTRRALDTYAVPDPIALLHELTRRGGPGPEAVDRLAPGVLDEADAGDEVAAAIVAGQGRILGDQTQACAERVGLAGGEFPVVLAGGVFRHPSRLLAQTLMRRIPGGRAVAAAHEPAVGALLFAFDRAGVAADEARLEATAPPAATYATAVTPT
jgi:N-acetylglucosamine kinase-like BadF-type ATPase